MNGPLVQLVQWGSLEIEPRVATVRSFFKIPKACWPRSLLERTEPWSHLATQRQDTTASDAMCAWELTLDEGNSLPGKELKWGSGGMRNC